MVNELGTNLKQRHQNDVSASIKSFYEMLLIKFEKERKEGRKKEKRKNERKKEGRKEERKKPAISLLVFHLKIRVCMRSGVRTYNVT